MEAVEYVWLALLMGLPVLAAAVWLRRTSALARQRFEFLDVSAGAPKGEVPGGTYVIESGIDEDGLTRSGVLSLKLRSTRVWVHEVWVRTDYGWVQLQPGPTEGMFRNALVAGVRLSMVRFWFAKLYDVPDERPLREAAGLLVPASLFLTRATPPVPARPVWLRDTPPTTT